MIRCGEEMLMVCGSIVCWLSLYYLISVGMSVVVSDVFCMHMIVLLWVIAVLYHVCFVFLPGDFPLNIGLLTFSNKFFKLNSISISRYFSFRFFSVSVFLCIFSLHDHDCCISCLHWNAFHTLSYISCNKSHKILVQNKDSKEGEFQVSCTKSYFLYSLCMSPPEKTYIKNLQLSQDLQIFSLCSITVLSDG